MMEGTPLTVGLSNNPEAIRKRNNRVALKEKRRQAGFINRYVQIKHPAIYTEAINIYQTFVDKYPGRADMTKTYYFKKWEEENKPRHIQSRQYNNHSRLYVPHLPILSELPNNTNVRVEIIEEGEQQQEETVDQTVQQEETVDQTVQQEETVDQTVQQEETIDQTVQQEETVDQTTDQEETVDQTVQQEETVDQTTDQESNDLCSGMTINEMSIAVEEIVKALQSDSDVMDIVENFDLPESVWNNELAIPDYILEGDLDW